MKEKSVACSNSKISYYELFRLSLSREIRSYSVQFLAKWRGCRCEQWWVPLKWSVDKYEQSKQKWPHSIPCFLSEEFRSVFIPRNSETLRSCNVIGALQFPLKPALSWQLNLPISIRLSSLQNHHCSSVFISPSFCLNRGRGTVLSQYEKPRPSKGFC